MISPPFSTQARGSLIKFDRFFEIDNHCAISCVSGELAKQSLLVIC